MSETTIDIAEGLEAKEAHLKEIIRAYGTLSVAFSGGVDSTYLADVAHDVLGQNATMVLADSYSLPRSEYESASEFAHSKEWNFVVVRTDEFENEQYLKNDGRRCYFCKSALFRKMKDYADANDVSTLAYGAMADDSFDPTRLGALAASEYDVVAPLQEAELGKEEIRLLSKRRDLPTAVKAAFACLSSRFPQGTRVTVEDLAKVEAAEEVLKAEGLYVYRARHHGEICRVEIDMRDVKLVMDPDVRQRIVTGVTDAGYKHVALDLSGYQDPNNALLRHAQIDD